MSNGLTWSLVLLGLVASGCGHDAMYAEQRGALGSDHEPGLDAGELPDADVGELPDADEPPDAPEETAECPDGHTLVGGSATCKYTLNAATATGSHVTWYIYPNPGECLCYLDADCKFNDQSTVCAGGALASNETYPCTATLTDTSWKYLLAWTKDQYTPATYDGCKAKCTAHYNAMTLTQKNNAAREACGSRVPEQRTVQPISCCIPPQDQ